jgi:hypothetical protein
MKVVLSLTGFNSLADVLPRYIIKYEIVKKAKFVPLQLVSSAEIEHSSESDNEPNPFDKEEVLEKPQITGEENEKTLHEVRSSANSVHI